MDFTNIILASSVVAGTALLLGVLLAVISRFFAVEEDVLAPDSARYVRSTERISRVEPERRSSAVG